MSWRTVLALLVRIGVNAGLAPLLAAAAHKPASNRSLGRIALGEPSLQVRPPFQAVSLEGAATVLWERAITACLYIVLAASFATRIVNINYNSPFNDEAIYIAVGRLGVFQGDWWTYNASAWFGGFPYIYPTASAIASVIGGVVGSRTLNVIIGVLAVEAIFRFVRRLSGLADPFGSVAGLLAGSMAGGAAIALYISRLATYDMPSFWLFFVSLTCVLRADQGGKDIGRFYFYGGALLLLSFLTKIIVILYIPFVVVLAWARARELGKRQVALWWRYFFLPLAIGILGFGLANIAALANLTSSHVASERFALATVVDTFWTDTRLIWPFWCVGAAGMLAANRWRLWALLTSLALWTAIPQLVLRTGVWAMEKHLFVSIGFLGAVAGIGIAELLVRTSLVQRATLLAAATVAIGLFWNASWHDAQKFNVLWVNTDAVERFMVDNLKPGDKILSEIGAATILATYDLNFPLNTVTFDYIEYHKQHGQAAYVSAIQEGYFDLVELQQPNLAQDPGFSRIQEAVRGQLAASYKLAYSDSKFMVYRRDF